ncbi:MAG: Dabb family protein [Defluviitaleaceae bacterium]|nr:Dabb family protein [Defluviitaleaceae bacterium]MCL2204301.1 Dabb family protein [Defluviitaleaceae bacterium]MCL2240527.1 Dabb family protein [Defluviitaleaceae bacterium]
MIRHMVAWNCKECFSGEEQKAHAELAKERFDALAREGIPGVAELDFRIDLLPASTRNVALYSLFEDDKALIAYKTHPIHMELVDIMAAYFQERICVDFVE